MSVPQPRVSNHPVPAIPPIGATLRELMDRMGHSTTRATLIYLHVATPARTRSQALSAIMPSGR